MRRNAPVVVVVSLAAIAVVAASAQGPNPYPPARPEPMPSRATSIQRGAQLVALGGCNDCHTPKLATGEFNMARLLSGQPLKGPVPPEVAGSVTANMSLTAWRGPWGLTISRNLTPDNATGIGKWTLADFKKTMRTGVDPSGVVLRPPMPIANYQNLPDEDLEAIFNYLRSIRPIVNDTSGRLAAAPRKGTGGLR